MNGYVEWVKRPFRRLGLAAVSSLIVIACVQGIDQAPNGRPAVDANQLRKAVVREILQAETARPADHDDIDAPLSRATAFLSSGGLVSVRRDGGAVTIGFFEARGTVDGWSGLVYRPKGAIVEDPMQGGGPIEVQDLGDGWFHVETD